MEFKKPIYPIEQWNITETEFKKENNYRNETTFALSNGYIGTRGTSRRRIHSMWIPVWKETSSTAFMKAMRSAMERRIWFTAFESVAFKSAESEGNSCHFGR